MNLLEKALNSVAEIAGHQGMELRLTMQHAAVLGSIRGVADLEVQKAYLRAGANYANSLPRVSQDFSIEFGLMMAHFVKGDLRAASNIAQNLHALAKQDPRKPFVDAYLAKGMIEMQFGRFGRARRLLEKAAAHTRPECDEPHLFSHGSNPRVFCRSYLAHVSRLWDMQMMHWPRSSRTSAWLGERARDPAHLYSYVDASAFAGRVHALFNDSDAVKHLSDELLAISGAQSLRLLRSDRHNPRRLGPRKAGQVGPGRSADASRPVSTRANRYRGGSARAWIYVQVAEFLVQLGNKEEASATLQKAAGPPGWGMRVWDAEIYRVHGEIAALQPGKRPRCCSSKLAKACQIARRQRAWTLELRATLSRTRLLQGERDPRRGSDVLATVLERYPASREILEVACARSLLADLRIKA